ncbi:hypothetical protein G6F37_005027 [Rhizopus arrhizus]|nr:hypothetical protein G6F38_003677 [Rhizopus arrhizus]KAG1159305.1 hypothetical protein G6F37_005027 [Rhizopus arrhizus]
MTSTIQPKPSTSTPILPSFFKPKSSTSTPLSSKKYKNTSHLQPDKKQRKRSTSTLTTTSEVPVNTTRKVDIPSPSFNRKLATVLSLKSYKKQPKYSFEKIKADVDAALLSKESTHGAHKPPGIIVVEEETRQTTQLPSELVKTNEIYNRPENTSSSGSFALTESESSSTSNTFNSNEINCGTTNESRDTLLNPLSEKDLNTNRNEYETIEIILDDSSCYEPSINDPTTILSIPEETLVVNEKSSSEQEDATSDTLCGNADSISQDIGKEIHPKASVSTSRTLSDTGSKHQKEEKTKKRPVSLLRRTRSRKWSTSSIMSNSETSKPPPLPDLSVCKNDPTTFLAGPAASMPTTGNHCVYKNHKFDLMNRLLESMMYGGHITNNLHTPMDLWYQTSVRLPYIEAKIAASELLIAVLEKMNARKNVELNMNAVMSELKLLRQTLNQINDTLMRKLGCPVPPIQMNKQHAGNSNRDSIHRTSQTIVNWSSKLSKMRFDSSRNNIPNDEQNQLYIKTLIKLLTDAKVLETWDSKLESLIEKAGKRESLVKEAYQSNYACISQFMSIVCSFILKDYDILLNKWFKRSTYWITE